MCLYAFGLITNDLCDFEVDRRERPERPLPSGQISKRSAIVAAVGLGGAGIVLGFGAGWWPGGVAAALAIIILLYNGWGKNVAVAGPVNMGLCRGMSLLLGAGAMDQWGVKQPMVIVSAVGLTLYVAAVTQIARREMERGAMGQARWGPTAALIAWLVAMQAAFPWGGAIARVLSGAMMLGAVGWSVWCARGIAGEPEPGQISRAIGGYLRGLLLVQAGLILTAVSFGLVVPVVMAIALVGLVPVSSRLAKRFYAS